MGGFMYGPPAIRGMGGVLCIGDPPTRPNESTYVAETCVSLGFDVGGIGFTGGGVILGTGVHRVWIQ